MSGTPNAPLLSPAQAARLLDDVLFTRVAELIDLPRLCDLEAMLALQIADLGPPARAAPARADPTPVDPARELARAMIDRALLRVARTSRRWTRCEPPGAGDACEICGSPCDSQEWSENQHPPADQ